MQHVVYPAVFTKDNDGGYLVTFPDFYGVTEGDNLVEAFNMAGDCLLAMINCEETLPTPTPYEKVVRDHPNDIVLLVKPCYWVHPNLQKQS